MNTVFSKLKTSSQTIKLKTKVAIIGGGPAGMLLSEALALNGIDHVILEKHLCEHVLARIRAGVLEPATVSTLEYYGLAERLKKEGQCRRGFKITWEGEDELYLDLKQLTGKTLTIYGQHELQHDLYQAADKRKAIFFKNVRNIQIYDPNTPHPHLQFDQAGKPYQIHCDFIIGCDGFHGISRKQIKPVALKQDYPLAWLGVLSPTPPLAEITYAYHSRGFALASARNPTLSRYYIQVPVDMNIARLDHHYFWRELKQRFPKQIADSIIAGSFLETSLTILSSYKIETMQLGRLFLAGDAAHIVPPTGAKGLNLAIADVDYLARALNDFYKHADETALQHYSQTATKRLASALDLSTHLTRLLHQFPGNTRQDKADQYRQWSQLQGCHKTQRLLGEKYIGLDRSNFT